MHLLAMARDNFICGDEQANVVNEGSLKKSHKVIWKTVLIDYFLSEVADLQPETF